MRKLLVSLPGMLWTSALLLSCQSTVQAFVLPGSRSSFVIVPKTSSTPSISKKIYHKKQDTLVPLLSSSARAISTTTTALKLAPTDAVTAAAATVSTTTSSSSDYLWQYFGETIIANGVPAGLALLVIFTAAYMFRPRSNVKALQESIFGQENPAFALYQDLYGDQASDAKNKKRNRSFLARLLAGNSRKKYRDDDSKFPLNIGIPAQQYFTVTHLNRKLDSYQYSLTAATQNPAVAAAGYRKAALGRILDTTAAAVAAADTTTTTTKMTITPSTWQIWQQKERDMLQRASQLLAELQAEQTLLAQTVLDQQLQQMGLTESPYQLDPPSPPPPSSSSLINPQNATTTATANNNNNTVSWTGVGQKTKTTPPNTAQIHQSIAVLQKSIQDLELDFIKSLVQAVGVEHAAVVRTALLGNLAVRGTGSLLRDLQDRPLNVLLTPTTVNVTAANTTDATTTTPTPYSKKKLFVTRFPGDATASQVATLREEVTAICQSAQRGVDEALVVLQSGGGTVTGYGLAAAQLLRLKQEAGLKLTVACEQVAASGGYMMCCVADHIVASPFAVLGSIGVITDIPNVYERLKQEGIEFQTVTAGKYKRTLTPTKKVTREDFEKTKADVEGILVLFRDFVKENRPQLDIDAVATGETWFGTAALERKLCDEINTVDTVLMNHVQNGYEVYEVKYTPPVETPFGTFVPACSNADTKDDDDASSLIGRAVRWLVRTVAAEIKSELAASDFSSIGNKPVHERYMMIDDRADRIKAQD